MKPLKTRADRKVEQIALLVWLLRAPKSATEIAAQFGIPERTALWYIGQARKRGHQIHGERMNKTFKYWMEKNNAN